MRICLVSREFPPFYGGGIGTYVLQAARALTLAGHHVVVLTVSNDGTRSNEPMCVHPDRNDGPHFLVERLPLVLGDDWSRPASCIADRMTVAAFKQLGPTSAFSIQVARALPDLAIRHRLDIVEGPECGAPLWWTLHERRCGLAWQQGDAPKFVVHLHSPNTWIDWLNRHVARKRAAIELREMERESAQMADLVISPSHDLATWAARTWTLDAEPHPHTPTPPTGRVCVLPYPLGTIETQIQRTNGRTESIPRDNDASGTQPLRVLFAGRLEPRKGIDLLMAAVLIAARAGVRIQLDVAGQDTWDGRRATSFARRTLLTMVPPELRERIVLHGKLTQEELGTLRERADCFAAPGAFDNFPYTVIEAMAAGMPIVAPRFGGATELVRDGIDGIHFEPHDSRSLADALVRLAGMDSQTLRKMGEAGTARVEAFCGNSRAVGERVRVFGSLAARLNEPEPTRDHRASEVVVLGRTSDAVRETLIKVVRGHSGSGPIGYAVPWGCTESANGQIIARGALAAETLALSGPTIGAVAVRRDIFDRMMHEHPQWIERSHTHSPQEIFELVTHLAAKGVNGVAVPIGSMSGEAPCEIATTVSAANTTSMDIDPSNLTPAHVPRLGPALASWREVPFPWKVVALE